MLRVLRSGQSASTQSDDADLVDVGVQRRRARRAARRRTCRSRRERLRLDPAAHGAGQLARSTAAPDRARRARRAAFRARQHRRAGAHVALAHGSVRAGSRSCAAMKPRMPSICSGAVAAAATLVSVAAPPTPRRVRPCVAWMARRRHLCDSAASRAAPPRYFRRPASDRARARPQRSAREPRGETRSAGDAQQLDQRAASEVGGDRRRRSGRPRPRTAPPPAAANRAPGTACRASANTCRARYRYGSGR